MGKMKLQVCGVTMAASGWEDGTEIYAPLKELAELLSLDVRSQPEYARVLLERQDVNISINDLYIDGGCLLDNTVYAPVDTVAEAFGAEYRWEPEQRLLEIRS